MARNWILLQWSGCGQSRNKSEPIDPRYKKYIGVFPSTRNKKSVKHSSHLVLHAALMSFQPPNPSQMARLGFLWMPWLKPSMVSSKSSPRTSTYPPGWRLPFLSWLHDGIEAPKKSKCRVKHRKLNQGYISRSKSLKTPTFGRCRCGVEPDHENKGHPFFSARNGDRVEWRADNQSFFWTLHGINKF